MVNRISTQIITVLLFCQIQFALPTTVSSRTLTSEDVSTSYPKNIQTWYGKEVVNENRTTCIKLRSALKVEMVINETTLIEEVPTTASPQGSCDEELQQSLDLEWISKRNNSDIKFLLILYFEKEVKDLATDKYILNAVHLEWHNLTQNGSLIPGKYVMGDLKSFETTITHSFKCSDELSIKKEFSIYFYDLQFQAFNVFNDSEPGFGEEDTCPKDARLKDMGKRLTSMISLLLGCVLVLFFLSWILQQILRRQCPVQFGYHNVN